MGSHIFIKCASGDVCVTFPSYVELFLCIVRLIFFQVQILVNVTVKIAGLLLLQKYCYATTNAT